MVKPSLFNLTTDFATLGNDAGTTVTVTYPGSQVINGVYDERHTDLTIGSRASLNRIQIASAKDSNIYQAMQVLEYIRTGTVAGSPSPYNVLAYAFRIAPSTLRCEVYVSNPYASPLTTEAGDEVFTFAIDTFIPPFA